MDEADLSALYPVLDELAPQGRTALLPALHAAQEMFGYVPMQASQAIGRALRVPLADIYGVIEFYTLFYSRPVAKTVVRVCNDPVCAMRGADAVFKMMNRRFEVDGHGAVTALTVEHAPCLGLCEHAPAILVNEEPRGKVATAEALDVTGEVGERPYGIVGGDVSILTANCGHRRSTPLAEYGTYRGLQAALRRNPAEVIEEVKASGLVGRGGAAFPTGIKWESAARAAGDVKYVVCNADEAEPGTFKDRVLMEEDPHRVLEGLLIAAYAIGANKAYIFIRGEYHRAYQSLRNALVESRQAGLLEMNTPGGILRVDIELRRGAGAYVCGEETALFEAIEGRRGYPRLKPPFPVQSGLLGKPTVINNVETLCNLRSILESGAGAYRRLGTEKSPGSKLFCVSGDVEKPGLYEVPFGVSLRHLLENLAGGMRSGRQLQAVLLGGAAGAFATADHLDVRLSFEDLKAVGLPVGSGVVTVFDETRDLRDALLRLARFFAEESCGKCYPCQLGTQRQLEIMERVSAGRLLDGDARRLQEVGTAMTDASICGLGQTASSAILSALRLFPQWFER